MFLLDMINIEGNFANHSAIYIKIEGRGFIKCFMVCYVLINNKIWWLCLVPTSTTRFATGVEYRMPKI